MADNTVKVTISAQDEATAILRKVQQELAALKGVTADVAKGMQAAGAASKESGDSFLGMVSNLKQLAIAYGALKVVDYVGGVIESAAATARLAQVTGVSTEKLSVLKVAAEENGVAFEDLNAGLRRFATAMGNLQTGKGGDVAADLKAIGLSAKDLQGLPLDQQLEKVVNAMAKYADGTDKMAIANKLFGRSGAELLPMFNAIANDGLAKVTQAAQANGEVLSTQAGQQALEFSADLKELKGSLQGLTVAVLQSGLLTALTQLVNLLKGAVNLLRESGPALGVMIPALGGLYQAEALKQQALAAQQKLTLPPVVVDGRPQIHLGDSAGAAKEGQEQLAALQAAAQQRLAIVRQEAADEFAEFQSAQRLGDQIEAARYAQGLVSLEAYFTLRRRAIKDNYDAEQRDNAKQIAAIQRATEVQVAALRAEPVNPLLSADAQAAERSKFDREARTLEATAAREIAAIRAKGAQQQIQAQTEVVTLVEEERVKRQAILDQVTALNDKLLAARGDTRAIAQNQIDKEIRDAAVTLGQAGSLTPAALAQNQDQLDTVKRSLELQADFAEAQRQAQLIQTQLRTDTEGIQNKIKDGTMGQLEGERAIAQLEANRVPALQAIAEKMADIAQQLGNPQLANEARALSVSIGSMGRQTDEAAIASANLGSNLGQVARSGLIEYFGSGISRANGFATALQGVVGQIQQLIAKAFVLQALKILGLGGGFSGIAGGSTAAAGGLGAGLAAGAFASGGPVTGPGTSTSDSVIARLSAGEYVMSASAVARHGSAFFSALNSGGAARPRMHAGLPGFADGGLVTRVATGAGSSHHEIHVVLDQGLILDTLRSSAGARVVINHLYANPKAARQAMRVNPG